MVGRVGLRPLSGSPSSDAATGSDNAPRRSGIGRAGAKSGITESSRSADATDSVETDNSRCTGKVLASTPSRRSSPAAGGGHTVTNLPPGPIKQTGVPVWGIERHQFTRRSSKAGRYANMGDSATNLWFTSHLFTCRTFYIR